MNSCDQCLELTLALPGFIAADEVAELEDDWVADGVHNGCAVTSPINQPCVVKDLQVLRDVRLVAIECADEFIYRLLTGFKFLQETQPKGLAQRSKPTGYEVPHLFGHTV